MTPHHGTMSGLGSDPSAEPTLSIKEDPELILCKARKLGKPEKDDKPRIGPRDQAAVSSAALKRV